MMQHRTISTTKDLVFRKKYICFWNSCTQFKFHEWLINESSVYGYFEFICSNDDEEENRDDVDRTEQICNFIDLPLLFVSQLISSTNKPLYFIKKIDKVTAPQNLSNTYGNATIGMYFRGFYLKIVRSKKTNNFRLCQHN